MARITINDIAKASGYSKTSVSFAFNDPGRISEKARKKILAVADQLGYIPDPLARSLSLRRHGSIGLLLPEVIPLAFLNPHLSQVVQGIGEVCERNGHSLTLIPPLRESLLEGVRSAAVDGLITIGLEPGMETVDIIRQRHIPFVTIDGRIGGGFPVVGIDDATAAESVMRYVLDSGHRRIAIVMFSDEPAVQMRSHVKTQRLAGYQRAVEATGEITFSDVTIVETESSIAGGLSAARTLFGGADTANTDEFDDSSVVAGTARDNSEGVAPPSVGTANGGSKPIAVDSVTAVVAMSDVIALGVLQYLEQARISVPETVSLVGFDDIPEASLVRPQLTTVAQSGYDKGRRAGEILIDLIAGRDVPGENILSAHLVERATCAPPRTPASTR